MGKFIEDLLCLMKKRIGKGGHKLQDDGKGILRVIFLNYWSRVKLPEKAMAPHSSTLAWKIPWMEEPGSL